MARDKKTKATETDPIDTPNSPPKNPTFRADDGSEIECGDDFVADVAKHAADVNEGRITQLRDKSGQTYSHVSEDADGRWLYRRGH